MRIFADLHIHGRYSQATSERMCPLEIAKFAGVKGLNLVGTGDFTHPKWLKELQENLVQEGDSCLYKLGDNQNLLTRFILSTEVNTVFSMAGKSRKVHHVILTPSFETAAQINDTLGKHGSLASDGRPTLLVSASALVEEVMSISIENVVFPAHAWTPWFGVFGEFSGFNSMEECYEDMTKHIHALETGLSSDPPMNWRLSKLDPYTLVSNSDSHSFWPWRMGREANVFELEELNYSNIVNAIINKDRTRFKCTIETDPAYGKYHWTGHRNCNVSLSAQDALKFNNICPVCRRKLTKGVEQRIEELADRPAGFKPKGAINFVHLLPLSEIIATVLRSDSPSTQKIWGIYNSLIQKFGTEYKILMDASLDALKDIVEENIANAIISVREEKAEIIAGYDGIYGKIVFPNLEPETKRVTKKVLHNNLMDFIF